MSRVVRNTTGEEFRIHVRKVCILKASPSSNAEKEGNLDCGVVQLVEMGTRWYFRFVNVNPHLPNVAGGVPPVVWVHTTVGKAKARMSKLRAGSHIGARLTLERGRGGRFEGKAVQGRLKPVELVAGGTNALARAGTTYMHLIGVDVEDEMRAMKGIAIYKEPDVAPFTVDPVIYAYGVFRKYQLTRADQKAAEEDLALKAKAMLHIEMMYRDMFGSTDLDVSAWAAGAPPPPVTALYERAQTKPKDIARYAYQRLNMRAGDTADFETFGRLLRAIDMYRTHAKMRILFDVGDLDHTGYIDLQEFIFIIMVLSRVPAPLPPCQLWETFQQFDGGHAAMIKEELWMALRMLGLNVTPKRAEHEMLNQLKKEAERRELAALQRSANIAATVAAEEKRDAERERRRAAAAGELEPPTCAEKIGGLIARPKTATERALARAAGSGNSKVVGVAAEPGAGTKEGDGDDDDAAVKQSGMAFDPISLGYPGFREVWANVVASSGKAIAQEELEKRKLPFSRSAAKNAAALLESVIEQDRKQDEQFYAAKLAALEDRRVERLSKEVGPSALAEITSKEGKLVRKQAALDDRRRQQLAAREAQRRRRQLKEEETLRAKIERESELRAQLVADGEKRRRAIEAEREERRRVEAGEHIIDWSNRGIALLPKELFLGAHNQERLGDVLTLDLSNNDLRLIPAFGALYWFNSLRKLDVSDNMLRELPGEINALTELVLMNAARNQMTSIPKEIGSLHELKALDLSHNLLSDLPLELSGLTTLTYLNLSSNKLLKLPRTMGQLSALRRLDVSSNALGTELGEALSSTLGDMEELEVLDLSWNAIAELPYSFGERQSKLHTLTLSNNKLTHLPDAIDGMVALESLVVARNGLLLLPEQMERLTALTRLVLPHNELPALPRCFGGLVNCTEMDLSHNRVAILDADAMSRLTSLVSLNLRSNQLEHLPKTIGALCVLETLELGFNVLHGQLATSIGTLTKLNALGIDNNRLEALPANIGFLKLLDELDASHNNLSYLPESIAQLNIRRLQLSNNRIRELPFALGELPNLEEFDISANSLECLPAGLGDLDTLRTLNCYNNRLSAFPLEMVDVVLGLELLNAGRNPFELVVRWVAALPADHPLVKSTSPRAAPRASPRASGAPALPPIRDSASAAAKRRERDVVFSEEKQVTTPQAMAWLAATELVFRPWLRVYNAVLKGTPIYLWPSKADFADSVVTECGEHWPTPLEDTPSAIECRCTAEDLYRYARENGLPPRFDAGTPEELNIRTQHIAQWRRNRSLQAQRAKAGQQQNYEMDAKTFAAEKQLFKEKMALPYTPPAVKVTAREKKRLAKEAKEKIAHIHAKREAQIKASRAAEAEAKRQKERRRY